MEPSGRNQWHEPAVGDVAPCIEVERYGRRPVAILNAPSAESARARGGLVPITTVLSRSDRGADKKWRRQ